ncbi:MAG: hypothetical protein ACFFBI_07525 [Promethearchaeota archaeon]
MKYRKDLDFDEFIGQHILLYGDTNTNKTYLTAKFIRFLLESENLTPKDISILDFAPKLTIINNLKIGGKIQDFYENSKKCNNIKFQGEIIPPRLTSSNINDLYLKAYKNFMKTSAILQIFKDNPSPILIINDISIHLHLGSIKLLLEIISKADTFFGNSYYGSSIKRDFATRFSLLEKRKVEYLIKKLDKSCFTG